MRRLESEDGRPLIGVLETGLLLPGELRATGAEAVAALEVALEFVDPASAVWTPTLVAGGLRPPVERAASPGLVISRKLADDLGLQVGSRAVLEHLHRMALVIVRRIETEVVVSGIHDNPVRALAHVDRGQRPFTGFEDATNVLSVVPAPGVDHDTQSKTSAVIVSAIEFWIGRCPFCPSPEFDAQVVLRNELARFVHYERYLGALKHSGVIVPVRHVETPFDLSEAEVVATFRMLASVKVWLDERFAPDGYNVGWNCGATAGQEVLHAHLHVIPRLRQEPLAGKGIRALRKSAANAW